MSLLRSLLVSTPLIVICTIVMGTLSLIDSFFDSVLVMDKDDSVRRNRLALLTRIRGLFSRVADFSKIQTA